MFVYECLEWVDVKLRWVDGRVVEEEMKLSEVGVRKEWLGFEGGVDEMVVVGG